MTGYKSPPPRPRSIFVPSTALNTICFGLAEQYGNGKSWAAVGDEIGVPGIVVYRAVVKQRYPISRKYRAALGLGKPRKPRRTRKRRNLLNLALGKAFLGSQLMYMVEAAKQYVDTPAKSA